MNKPGRLITICLTLVTLASGCATQRVQSAVGTESMEASMASPTSDYLPNADAAQVLSVTNAGPATAVVVVQTQAVAVKETGPKETVARFGEVYAFRRRSSPSIGTNRR